MSGGISRFEKSERLGEGGMGVVYRARDTFLKRDVALKQIKPVLAEDTEVRARFLRECRAAAAINHPNVATIFEAGEGDNGSIYLASELIRGESLVRRLRHGRIPFDEQLDLGIQLTQGLAAAHEAGIVHRDVKPGNVMVTDDGRLKILDFGLARLNQPLEGQADDDPDTLTRTRPGHFLGTPAYMSPEQVTGAEVDATSDVFSCGCVLYEMASGKAPFSAESVSETIRRILTDDPPDLDALALEAPKGLVDIIRKALAKNPADRFADASEMADALAAVRDQTTPASVHETESRPARGRRVGIGLAAAAAIVAAALLSWFFGRSARSRPPAVPLRERVSTEPGDFSAAADAPRSILPRQRVARPRHLPLRRRSGDAGAANPGGRGGLRAAGNSRRSGQRTPRRPDSRHGSRSRTGPADRH
jgi:serine/threonine-protein kinase